MWKKDKAQFHVLFFFGFFFAMLSIEKGLRLYIALCLKLYNNQLHMDA